MTKYTAAQQDELPEGGCKLLRVGEHGVALFRVEGEYRAYKNFCPHAGAPLCAVRPGEEATGRAGYEEGRQPASLRCPWHGWEFDLRTGSFLNNPRCRLDQCRVEVADGVVSVYV